LRKVAHITFAMAEVTKQTMAANRAGNVKSKY